MRRAQTACFILLIGVLLLTGCGQKSVTGSVKGRVVDNTNKGVANATVMFEGRPEIAHTNADGNYVFPVMPPGKYAVLATKQGYSAAGLISAQNVSAQRARVEVYVQPSKPTTVPDIVLLPDGRTVDTTAITQVSPQLATQLDSNNIAGISVDINYALHTEAVGRLYLYIYTQNGATVARGYTEVVRGADTVRLALNFVVPYTNALHMESLLTNADGRILAVNYTPAYTVNKKTPPSAPNVTVGSIGLGGVRLKFSGGNLYDCGSLDLYRVTNGYSTKLATINDLGKIYTDATVQEGTLYEYYLRLTTKDDTVFDGSKTPVNVPRIGFKLALEGANLATAVLAHDPTRGVMYMADHLNKKMTVINTDTFQEIRSVDQIDVPTALTVAADGSALYGVTASGKAFRFDPNTLAATQVSSGLQNPKGVAIHPNGETLYVSDADGVHAIKIADGTKVTQNLTKKGNVPLDISSDGTYLFTLRGEIVALNTLDLSEARKYLHYNANYEHLSVLNNTYSQLLFSDGYVYKAAPAWHQVDRLDEGASGYFIVIGASQDQRQIYVTRYVDYRWKLAVYENSGITWDLSTQIDVSDYSSVTGAFSALGGQKVCAQGVPKGWQGGPIHIFCFNLTEREAAQ